MRSERRPNDVVSDSIVSTSLKGRSAATRADALHARLRSRLIDGRFAPGEQISIRQIADAEGTSMIPARDALRGLVAEGALEFRGARAIAVPAPSTEMLGEIAYARTSLEGELAVRAAPALVNRIDELEALDAGVDSAIAARDVNGYMAANRAFHFAIYRAADAPILMTLVELLWLRIGPSMRLICEGLNGHLPAIDQHRNAIGALVAQDGDAFRSAIEADIAQGMSAIVVHSAQARREPTETPS